MAGLGRVALCTAGLWLLAGCEGGSLLGWLGIRAIHEVPVEQALAPDRGDRLVAVREPGARGLRLRGAELLGHAEVIPPSLLATEGWVLVVASERDESLRLAARLVREGLPRVAVVTGDLDAIHDVRTASRDDDPALQPFGSARHPSHPTN